MKKIFTVLTTLLLATSMAWAQDDEGVLLQFVDSNGNVVADGSTVVIDEPDIVDYGAFIDVQVPTGLSVKNAGDDPVYVGISYQVRSLSNGSFQICFPMNCIAVNNIGSGKTPTGVMNVGEVKSLQSEWIPTDENSYGSCSVVLQANAYSSSGTLIGSGPTVFVEMNYKAQEAKQMVMGAYTTDDVATSQAGIGLPGYPGTLSVASLLPNSVVKDFDGGKVVKMRVGLANSSKVSRVFILAVTASGNIGSAIVSQDVDFSSTGWNEVELNVPTTLDLSDGKNLLIGFDYVQGSDNQSYNSYPLSLVNVGDVYPVYIYGNLGQGTGWYSLGTNYGNLSVQAIVENENFPEKNLIIDELTVSSFVGMGEDVPFEVKVHNFGTKNVEKFELDFDMLGSKILTKDFTQTVGNSPVTVKGELPARLFDGLKSGSYTLTICVNSFDGEQPKNVEDGSAAASFYLYDKTAVVERQKFLVEEMTSHSCTYCPYGTNIVKALHETYDDVAIACIHGTQNPSRQDPWETAECDALNTLLGLYSWPSGAMNRIYDNDEKAILLGLGYNPQYAQQLAQEFHEYMKEGSLPAFASVDIKAQADGTKLNIVVSGSGSDMAKDMLENASLTVYVTEDGIIGQQLNLGTWVSNFEHNHVLRDVVTEIVGDDLNWTSNSTYENTYETTLGSDWKLENLKVVAFIAQKPTSATNPDRRQMAVSNANDAAISNATAIRSLDTTSSAAASCYSVDGRQVSTPQRGLNIVRMGDGKVTKVIVK